MAGRDVILLCTFVVTVGTLMLQGLSLPSLIRLLGVQSTDEHTDTLAEAQVKYRAAKASVERLDQATSEGTPEQVVTRLKLLAEHRGNAAWERLGRSDDEIGETPAARWQRLRLTMLLAEREVFLTARDAHEIDDEVFRRVQRELDLEEAAVTDLHIELSGGEQRHQVGEFLAEAGAASCTAKRPTPPAAPVISTWFGAGTAGRPHRTGTRTGRTDPRAARASQLL